MEHQLFIRIFSQIEKEMNLQSQVKNIIKDQSRDYIVSQYNQLTDDYLRTKNIKTFNLLQVLKDEIAFRIRNVPWIIGVAFNPYLADPVPIDLKIYMGYGNIGLRDPQLGYIKGNLNYMEKNHRTLILIRDNQVDPQLAMMIRDFIIQKRDYAKVTLETVRDTVFPDQELKITNHTTVLVPVLLDDYFQLYSHNKNALKIKTYLVPINIDNDIVDYLTMYRSIP